MSGVKSEGITLLFTIRHFQAVTDWDRARWTMGDDLKERIRQPGLAQARARMDDIKQLLERHNIAFSVVVYPWADH